MWQSSPRGVCVLTQSCPTLYNPRNCNLPSSSVHGILQARKILEWVAMLSSRGFSWLRDWTCVFCVSWISKGILYHLQGWVSKEHPALSCQLLLEGYIYFPGRLRLSVFLIAVPPPPNLHCRDFNSDKNGWRDGILFFHSTFSWRVDSSMPGKASWEHQRLMPYSWSRGVIVREMAH